MASPSRQNKESTTGNGEGGGKREKGLEGSSLKKTREEAAGGGDIETRGSSVVDDMELTDSFSTGEFPSDVTFRCVCVCVGGESEVTKSMCRGGRQMYHN